MVQILWVIRSKVSKHEITYPGTLPKMKAFYALIDNRRRWELLPKRVPVVSGVSNGRD